ncbi:MAG: dihydroneopterin aldolase [Pseudomonadota bacterium]
MTNSLSDELCIHNLSTSILIGVYPWERQIRQPIELDITMPTDARRAAAHDRLADAIDYGVISARILSICAETEFQLIESLAEHLCTRLLAEFDLPYIRLTLRKPGAIPGAKTVALTITRSAACPT